MLFTMTLAESEAPVQSFTVDVTKYVPVAEIGAFGMVKPPVVFTTSTSPTAFVQVKVGFVPLLVAFKVIV